MILVSLSYINKWISNVNLNKCEHKLTLYNETNTFQLGINEGWDFGKKIEEKFINKEIKELLL